VCPGGQKTPWGQTLQAFLNGRTPRFLQSFYYGYNTRDKSTRYEKGTQQIQMIRFMNRLLLQFSANLHLRRYSENSIQNHRLDLMRLQEWLEKRNGGEAVDLAALKNVTLPTIQEYQNALARRLKPRSINRHLSSIRLFFNFLEESGLLSSNPMDMVVFPKVYHDLPTMLTPGEVTTLLDTPAESHYLGLRDKTMLELLYSCGFKLNELIALDVSSLQLDLGFVRVDGKRNRMVPLTDRAVELLKRFLAESRPGRVLHEGEVCLFPGRNGTRISRIGIWKLIKKYAGQAAIKKNFNPRTLRHAFAIHLLLGGMDLDQLKFLFGYRHLDATTLYAHVNTPDFRKTYQAYHPNAQYR